MLDGGRSADRLVRPGDGVAGGAQGAAAGGERVLERAIARVRAHVSSRLWRLLAVRISPDQKEKLDALLVIGARGAMEQRTDLRSVDPPAHRAQFAMGDGFRQGEHVPPQHVDVLVSERR